MEGASGRLSRSSGGCLRRRNSCAETVPRPEQQQQQPQQPQQQPPPPPQRCQAITCLIPVGKLAPANFSRLSRHEVSRTSRRLRGARARARSPARFPLPPLPPAALAPGLSPACALSARLSPPAPSARHWAGVPPNSDQSHLDVHSVLGAQGPSSRSRAVLPPPASLAFDPGRELWRRFKPRQPAARAGAGPSPEELEWHAEPTPRLKPECGEAQASAG